MLRTFKAVLKGDRLEWVDEIPETRERPFLVHVTLVEEDTVASVSSRGQQMSEILSQLAEANTFSEVNPIAWQREVRQDRSMSDRD
jgi:hypothetical protein